jgi:hypothetical protein
MGHVVTLFTNVDDSLPDYVWLHSYGCGLSTLIRVVHPSLLSQEAPAPSDLSHHVESSCSVQDVRIDVILAPATTDDEEKAHDNTQRQEQYGYLVPSDLVGAHVAALISWAPTTSWGLYLPASMSHGSWRLGRPRAYEMMFDRMRHWHG